MKKLSFILVIASFVGCNEVVRNGNEVTQIDKLYPEFTVPEKITQPDIVKSPDLTYAPKPKGFVLPEEFKVATKEFKVDPKKATDLKINSKGTTLHIPENAFVDKNGKAVKGEVSISFREFTNPAEIAFSFLPMTYKTGGVEYNFNSAGMFEINGKCGNDPVSIANGKQIRVDYNIAQQTPEMSFFALDKNTNAWTKVQDIPKQQKNGKVQTTIQTFGGVGKTDDKRTALWVMGEDSAILFEDSVLWYEGKAVKGATELIRKVGKVNERVLVIWEKTGKKKEMKVVGEVLITQRKVPAKDVPWINGRVFRGEGLNVNATLLGGGSGADAGHTYPDIVRGLNVSSFGVYNCDQIYRVGQPVNIMATYKDEAGNIIKDLTVLSMIDLNYNGAFSFNPNQFMCSATGRNVLLLFTKEGKLYMLEEDGFKKMQITANGSYAFTMKDVTERIKGTKDLAGALGIKM